MAQRHLVYIISHIEKSLAFEWIACGLKHDYKLTFLLLNDAPSSLEEFLRTHQVEVKRISYRGKRDFVFAFIKTFFFFLFNRPNIIHAHLIDAQLIGLTAAWFAGIRKRIYTRHTSNYHHVYHPRGVRFDLWSNRMATQIVSISQATDFVLKKLEQVAPKKIKKVPHGFELNTFSSVKEERIQQIRKKWKIHGQQIVIGVIARHIEWKGIQYIIPAFQKFLKVNPNAYLVLANAMGPFHSKLVEMLKDVPADRYSLIPFEEDVAALYAVFDLYVHTPIDSICEAFGQTYVEALAAGVPSIFTLSGVAAEFIVHGRNAWVVDFKDDAAIYDALLKLWNDVELRKHLIENGTQDVNSRFGVMPMLTSLRKIYDE